MNDYEGAIAHVGDASLVVNVANDLLSPDRSEATKIKLKEDYAMIRERFLSQKKDKKFDGCPNPVG
jgi:cobalamin-dependent methionine synthase I